MKHKGNYLALFSMALFIWTISVSIAHAILITTYTDRAAWNAAVGNNFVLEDFNSVPDKALSLGLNDAGLFDIRLNGAGIYANRFTGENFVGETRGRTGTTLDFVFEDSIIGFGGDWFGTLTNSLLLTTISGQTIKFSNHLTTTGDGFLGFISDTAFIEASISDESIHVNEVFGLDNLSFSASVPEPTTLALMGFGLIGIGFSRRK